MIAPINPHVRSHDPMIRHVWRKHDSAKRTRDVRFRSDVIVLTIPFLQGGERGIITYGHLRDEE